MNGKSLRQKLLIAQLNVSKWGAKTYDKKAIQTIENAYHTQKNIGRFQKEIVDSKELKEIDRISSQMRTLHYNNTLPWGDNGDRLLPIVNYSHYNSEMQKLISQFNIEVSKFVSKYPVLKETARQRLGGLFDAKNYPDSVSDKFNVKINYYPVPVADDIRLDLPTVDIKDIRKNISETVNEKLNDAVNDVWVRMEILLQKMIERLSDPDNKFKNSLVDNIAALIEITPKLNVFNDPNLSETCNKMKELLVDPDNLRVDKRLRQEIAQKAAQLSKEVQKLSAVGSRFIEL